MRQLEQVQGHLLGAGPLALAEELVVVAEQDRHVQRVGGVALPGTAPRVGHVEVRQVGLGAQPRPGRGPRPRGRPGRLGEGDVGDEVDDRHPVAAGLVDAVALQHGGHPGFVAREGRLQAPLERRGEVVGAARQRRDGHDHAVRPAVAHRDGLAPAGPREEGLEGVRVGEARVRGDRPDDVAVDHGLQREGHRRQPGGELRGRQLEERPHLLRGGELLETERRGGDAVGELGDGLGDGLDDGAAAQSDQLAEQGLGRLEVVEAGGLFVVTVSIGIVIYVLCEPAVARSSVDSPAPMLLPRNVTLPGSPPNPDMCFWTQRSPNF